MEKTIRQQIKDQPELHRSYFTCIGFSIFLMLFSALFGPPLLVYSCFPFLAASIVIAALIDVRNLEK